LTLTAKVQKIFQTWLSSFCVKNCGGSRDERKLLSAKVPVLIPVDETLFSLARVDLTVAVFKTLG